MGYVNIIVVICVIVTQIQGSCIVTSNSTRQPVYLRNDTSKYEFVIPKKDGINLQQGEKIILLCPGHLNRLNQSNSNISIAICVNGDKFLLTNKVYKFDELECKRSIRGSVQNTNTVCPNGMISNIGYYIGGQFLSLIEVCYDSTMGNTIYTRHTLHGDTIGESEFAVPHSRPNFNTKGLNQENKAVSLVYQIVAQRSRLSSILQSSIAANTFVTNSSYLDRGHLSPDGDFMFVSWQYTTYFFINVCPQWSVVNRSNWKKVENMIRKVAKALQENLQIITGTHEVLELPDRYGNLQPLYLSQRGKKFPVPRFVWKIVYSEKSRKAMVLVSYNNPYASSGKYLCSCICNNYGWSATQWSNVEKGFIQCCSYAQFKTFVRNAPNLSVNGILQAPICK